MLLLFNVGKYKILDTVVDKVRLGSCDAWVHLDQNLPTQSAPSVIQLGISYSLEFC